MTRLVLASGQSNMSGRGTGGTPLNRLVGVTVWNNTNEGGANGTAFVSPPANGNPPWDAGGGNNLAAWFCQRLASETGDDVRLILVSKGGMPISAWSSTAPGEMWSELDDVCTAAAAGPADIFLWHQGENDEETPEATYKEAFLALRAVLRSSGYLAETAPCIVGGLREIDDTFLRNLAAENEGVYFADATPYPDTGDDVHFTGPALRQFGYEGYWGAYARSFEPSRVNGKLLTVI